MRPGMSTGMLADRTYDEDVLTSTEIGRSLGTDYFGLRDELTDAERDYLKRTLVRSPDRLRRHTSHRRRCTSESIAARGGRYRGWQ